MLTPLRSLAFFVLLILWVLVLAAFCLPTLFFPRDWAYRYSVLWAHGTMWLLRVVCGLRYEVRGAEHISKTPVIYAMKHQSAWETIAMLVIVPPFAGVLKKQLMRIPIYGWYMYKIGMIPIDREGAATTLKAMVRAARSLIDGGRSIMIMPEGTRTAPGRTGRYQPGVAALYKQLGVPVVPVALNSGLYWGRRALNKRPGTVIIEFLEPIEPGMARPAFMKTLEERIETASEELRIEGLRRDFPEQGV